RIRAPQGCAYEAAGPALAFEQLLEVLERRARHDERVAEDVLLGTLQRLHEHEVDREEAVGDGQDDQSRVADPRPPGSRVQASSGLGASNSRNSTTRVASNNGTSVRESAEAGPNCPALTASQYAWVLTTGNAMRPPVSDHTLAKSAKALVRERNAASARNGFKSGIVTDRKRCQALFESRRADSNSSGGMALMPASRKTPMNE